MEKLMEVKNLSVSYFTYAGEVQSVRGISFDVKKGKTTAIVGESGCGKSVTAKSLMGLIEKPGKISTESHILYRGKEITGYTEKEWNAFRGKECSMVFQDALVSLNPTMKVGKQIEENPEFDFIFYVECENLSLLDELKHFVCDNKLQTVLFIDKNQEYRKKNHIHSRVSYISRVVGSNLEIYETTMVGSLYSQFDIIIPKVRKSLKLKTN